MITKDTAVCGSFMVGGMTVHKLSYDVLSDASGDAALELETIHGSIDKLVLLMDEANPPDAAFSVALYNRDSTYKFDLLNGKGESLAQNDVEIRPVSDGLEFMSFVSGRPYIVFSDMGDTTRIRAELWVIK